MRAALGLLLVLLAACQAERYGSEVKVRDPFPVEVKEAPPEGETP